MPISYILSPDQAVLHITYSGVINLHDVLAFLDAYERDMSVTSDADEFCDMSGVLSVAITSSELQGLFEVIENIYRRHRIRRRIVFYTPHDPVRRIMPGFVQHMTRHMPTVRVACFDEQTAARAFLGLAPLN